ncbi:hypothetical protein [Flavobacterium yafengii]|uniref:hypothetical protein n=1 Tax=Flavobacterium yafengii TaxID=3041253 RepID=UPI0024A91DCF|nr:hypothetical protein [Flavobacterium yafengii]MDI5897913.1 hypothetical protein [Flavobacterium yafengii]
MKKLLVGAILLFSIISCSKDGAEETTPSVVFKNENLKYKRLLKEVVEQKDPAKGDSTVYKYDELKRLVSKDWYKSTTRPNNNGTTSNVQRERYTYNENNQINCIYRVSYNMEDRVIVIMGTELEGKITYNKQGMPIYQYLPFVFDENGHYIENNCTIKWDNNNNKTQMIYTSLIRTYTYDDKHNVSNAVYDTSWVRFYSGGENNVLTYSADGVPKLTYEYEYNSDFFPTKVTITELDNIYNDRIKVVNYIYEK